MRAAECAVCGGPIEQPATGRRRAYDSAACRRAAEYRLRRIQDRIRRAERAETAARERLAAAPHVFDEDKRRAEFWQGEVARLEAELLDALRRHGPDPEAAR